MGLAVAVAIAAAAAASAVSRPGITCMSRVSSVAQLTREGTLESLEVKGTLSLTANNDGAKNCMVVLSSVDVTGMFTFQTHPKVRTCPVAESGGLPWRVLPRITKGEKSVGYTALGNSLFLAEVECPQRLRDVSATRAGGSCDRRVDLVGGARLCSLVQCVKCLVSHSVTGQQGVVRLGQDARPEGHGEGIPSGAAGKEAVRRAGGGHPDLGDDGAELSHS